MPITSSHNDKLKTVRKLHTRRRERELAHAFVAEGEDLLEAADLAGWTPLERFAASGSGLPGTEVTAEALQGRGRARLGDTDAGDLRAALGAGPAGPALPCTCTGR